MPGSLSARIHGDDPETSALFRRVLGKCRFVHGSVEDPTALADAIEGASYVIHLAAETGTGQSMYEVGRYARANIQGTAELIEMLTKNRAELGLKQVVLTSSRSIYGQGMSRCAEPAVVYPEQRSEHDLPADSFRVPFPA